MNLFLEANSKNGVGYFSSDWITLVYPEGNEKRLLKLHFWGDIQYTQKDLRCECTGELVPYVLMETTGISQHPVRLSACEKGTKDEITEGKLIEIFQKADISIRVYPIPTIDMQNPMIQKLIFSDVLSQGKGQLTFEDGKTVSFSFTAENK